MDQRFLSVCHYIGVQKKISLIHCPPGTQNSVLGTLEINSRTSELVLDGLDKTQLDSGGMSMQNIIPILAELMIANTPLFHTSLNNTDNIHSVHQHPTTFCWFLQSDTIQSCQNYLLGMTCPVILTTAIFYKPSILNLDILSKQSQISKIFNYTYFWFALDLAMQDKINHDDTNEKLNLILQINKLEMTQGNQFFTFSIKLHNVLANEYKPKQFKNSTLLFWWNSQCEMIQILS